MAIVHEYVPTSAKSGLYIRDGYGDDIVTYQVSPNAEKLLRKMRYSDEDPLPYEIFTVLHQLGLIYTHRSGVEPPDSLLDIDLSSNDVEEMKETDREAMLSYLLSQADLGPGAQHEVQTYANRHEIDINAPNETVEDNRNGRDSKGPSKDHKKDGKSRRNRRKSRFHSKTRELPRVRCKYCDESVEAVDYIFHVRSLGGVHEERDTLPDGFIPGNADIDSEGDIDIVYPDVLSTECRYYPVCRWCGKRFIRLPAYDIHLKSNRESFNEPLHNRNRKRYSRPVLLPYRARKVAVHKNRLTDSVTREALNELQFATGSEAQNSNPGSHEQWQQKGSRKAGVDTDKSDPAANESSAEDSTETDEKQHFEGRSLAYEQSWVLSDLSRFYNLLLRTYERGSAAHNAVAAEHHRSLDRVRNIMSQIDSTTGSLREYKKIHKLPEIGVKVPRDLLEDINVGDYRGEMFLPPGYPIPVESIHRRLIEAWLEQEYPNLTKEKVQYTGKSEGNSEPPMSVSEGETSEVDEPIRSVESKMKSIDQDQSVVETGGGSVIEASDVDLVPLLAMIDVLKRYLEYENDHREASWFHASQILKEHISSSTGLEVGTIESLMDIRDTE